MPDETVNVRYMVDDVRVHRTVEQPTSVRRRAARAAPPAPQRAPELCRPAHGRRPTPGPGGWNRIHLITSDLASEVDRLRGEGVRFRNDVVTGPGGSQIFLQDPSGNLVELFQPAG